MSTDHLKAAHDYVVARIQANPAHTLYALSASIALNLLQRAHRLEHQLIAAYLAAAVLWRACTLEYLPKQPKDLP